MPKQRITKDMILQAAYCLALEQGEGNVTVKQIASRLNCSVQPLYSYFENIEHIKAQLCLLIGNEMRLLAAKNADKADLFRSTGLCYLKYAQEKPNLYKMYFLRARKGECIEEIICSEANPQIAQQLSKQHNISIENAAKLHRLMIIFNVGISFAITGCGNTQGCAEYLATAYNAFLNQINKE